MSNDVVNMTPLSVLLAEDNLVNQRVATALLTTIGHRVTVCANGREAVDAVRDGNFDIILMDIQMPVLDGLAATAEIRALPDPAKARIPILAISANVRDEDLDRYRAAGITHMLSKPLRPQTLKAMLNEALGHQAPAAPVPAGELMDRTQIAALQEALRPEKLAELYAMAHQSLRDGAEMLRQGWQKGDSTAIKTAAHRVAGVARNFGCLALGQCAGRIEDAAQAGGHGKSEQATFETLLTASLAALPIER